MAVDRKHLQWFYEQTHYTVVLAHQQLTFRIGHHDPALDQILRERCHVHSHWAMLTPCNPSSEATDEDANHMALARLRRELDEASIKYFNSVNQSPEGEWHELGFLLVDPEASVVRAAARRYRQNAYVAAKLGEASELVWMI